MRVILAGGGTGGHVIPALAIAHELQAHYNAELLFIGTARGLETRLVPAAGFSLKLLQIGALNRVSLATRIQTLIALPRAIARAWAMVRDFRPDVIIGVGGYASGPTMLVAALMGVPTLAFEPNVVPGFANRLLAVAVSMAAVQFEETCRQFRRCIVTGVPVRRAFFETPAKTGSELSLLVFGGSQGAHALNQVMMSALPLLRARVPGIHIVHQTGERDYNDAQAIYLHSGVSAEISPFIENMPETFSRADLLLCRSGASTIGEITAAGKPAILVPFPKAADDHQLRNAEALVRAGAAVLIEEKNLTVERLADTVAELLPDRARLAGMGAAARALAHAGAGRQIADVAARLAGTTHFT